MSAGNTVKHDLQRIKSKSNVQSNVSSTKIIKKNIFSFIKRPDSWLLLIQLIRKKVDLRQTRTKQNIVLYSNAN